MSQDGLHILLFSYNRGQFLQNCVASIERHSPEAELHIWDDLSDEPNTRKMLDKLSARYTINQPKEDSGVHKLGGLYNNMQSAFESLPPKALFCCLQDDMQIVRDVSDADLRMMQNYFEQNPNAGFLHHAFMKGHQRARYARSCQFDESRQVYFRETNDSRVGEYFSDIFTSRVDRLKRENWRFQSGEKQNNLAAAKLFDRMGFMQTPFVHWLPCVPSYRHKRKTRAIKIAERRTGAGFYPFNPMGAQALGRFLNRNPGILPIAEDFLTTEPPAPIQPWIYHPLQGAPRWIYLLNKIESTFR